MKPTHNPPEDSRLLLPVWLFWPLVAVLALLLALGWDTPAQAAGQAATPARQPAGGQGLPERLSDTGFFTQALLSYSPQYPLWSDGSHKRRWLYLPAGRFIDARQVDAWVFPVGTKLWKEFAYGARVETRYMERRADGRWVFATYRWNKEGSDAVLAPAAGAVLAVEDAPGARYELPSRSDCLACHSGLSPVLGASALQLSAERDAGAVPSSQHAVDVDLSQLLAMGLVRHLPLRWQQQAPRIEADDATERAARGYLHGNCGHCHRAGGVPVPLQLAQTLAPASGATGLHAAAPGPHRDAGAAKASLLTRLRKPVATLAPTPSPTPAPLPTLGQLQQALHRMASRQALTQMPPLGTHVVDAQGLALVQRWLASQETPIAAAPRPSPATQAFEISAGIAAPARDR